MVEIEIAERSEVVLRECIARGLKVRSIRELAGYPGSRHWHLGKLDRPGTLEISECEGRVWLKVHPRRDGGWAGAFARELSQQWPEPIRCDHSERRKRSS